PGGLGPAARVGGVAEGRAADRGHVPRGGRVLDAVAAVAGGHRDRNARVVEVGVVGGLGARLAAAVAVGDHAGAEPGRRVLGRVEAGVLVVGRLDQEDLAAGADGRGHLQIELGLERPALVVRWVAALRAGLVDLLEAAVGRGAGRQAVIGAIGAHVG